MLLVFKVSGKEAWCYAPRKTPNWLVLLTCTKKTKWCQTKMDKMYVMQNQSSVRYSKADILLVIPKGIMFAIRYKPLCLSYQKESNHIIAKRPLSLSCQKESMPIIVKRTFCLSSQRCQCMLLQSGHYVYHTTPDHSFPHQTSPSACHVTPGIIAWHTHTARYIVHVT